MASSKRLSIKVSFYLRNLNKSYGIDLIELNPKFIQEFFFIESIENIFLTGQLHFVDTDGMFLAIPVTGNEVLKVVMTQEIPNPEDDSKSIDITKNVEFDIWNMKVIDVTLKSKTYELYLVEKGAFDFMINNRSIGYKNKRISDIVTDVLQRHTFIDPADMEVEKTNEVLDNFQIPWWPPSLVMKHLARMARRNKTPNEAGFLFYSTLGDYTRTKPLKKFVSFASLLEEKFDIADARTKYYMGNVTVSQYFINVIKEMENADYTRQSTLKDGLTGKRYYGIDYATDKNIIELKQNYTDFFNSSKMIGKVSYFPSDIDDFHGDIKFYGATRNQLQARQDWSFRMLLEGSNRRDILCEGFLFRHAGQIIYIEQVADGGDDLYQKHDSGKWIIKTLTHYYKHGLITHKMTILKDAYNESDVQGHPTK